MNLPKLKRWWRMVRSHICKHFQTSFVLELVAMLVFALKLLMLVMMKGLLSFYYIDISNIHETQNAKELCLFENPAYFSFFFFCTICLFSRSPTSTMVTASPAPSKLVPSMIDQ